MRSRRAAASDSAQWTRLNERFRKANRKVNEGTKGTMPHVCGGVCVTVSIAKICRGNRRLSVLDHRKGPRAADGRNEPRPGRSGAVRGAGRTPPRPHTRHGRSSVGEDIDVASTRDVLAPRHGSIPGNAQNGARVDDALSRRH